MTPHLGKIIDIMLAKQEKAGDKKQVGEVLEQIAEKWQQEDRESYAENYPKLKEKLEKTVVELPEPNNGLKHK